MSRDKKALGSDLSIGRPTKYRPEYCEMLIAHMKTGMTFDSFAGHPEVGVSRDSLYEWVKVHSEFSDAKRKGRSFQLYKDEQTLAMLTEGLFEKGSTSAHIFKMKNCHNWTDKQEVQNTNVELSYEEYIKKLEGENAN